jgi:hypothetical protein
MVTERDLDFSSSFMTRQIPKEKSWMMRYFKTRTKRMFLKYFVRFGSTARFCEHSGEVCTVRYIKKMKKQFLVLDARHEKAKNDLDFDLLAKIEMGKCKLSY